MRKVWKFRLEMIDGPQTISMPDRARVVAIGMQGHGNLVMWAECETDLPPIQVTLRIVGTGHEIPDGWVWRGTTQDDPFVWHVYELP